MRSLTEHLGGARAFLDAAPDAPLWVIASTRTAARALIRDEVVRGDGGVRALSGWRASSLTACAEQLAAPALDQGGLSYADPLVLEGIVLELLARRAGGLGRYAASVDSPGLVRALTRTLGELAEGDVAPSALLALPTPDPVLSGLYAELRRELAQRKLLDRAGLFETAIRAVERTALPRLLLLEVTVTTALEGALVRSLIRCAPDVLAVCPAWDTRTRAALGDDLELATCEVEPLRALAGELFSPTVHAHPGAVERFSARTEREECAEIASRILARAAEGTSYRRMAIVLGDPAAYRAPLSEALARAGITSSVLDATRRPSPSGRALLALLDCALEGLSARAFAEYLSFSVLPPADGAPPDAWPSAERTSDDDDDDDERGGERAGSLRTPYRFERVLVDAAVVGGGAERWSRRLAGLSQRLEHALAEADDDARDALVRQRSELADFEAFALPLVRDLEQLDHARPLHEHLDAIEALATRALARPRRVLAVLSGLRRLRDPHPLRLRDVRALLDRPLRDVPERERGSGARGVEVLSLDAIRGRRFDHVFLPGMSERVFPRPQREDPILDDEARRALAEGSLATASLATSPLASSPLATRHERILRERDALRAAVGAARCSVTASHARVDGGRGRAQLPSLYLLELARAAEAHLPAIEDAAPPAARSVLGTPDDPARAIDAIEHGLSMLAQLLAEPAKAKGRLRYLFDQQPTLRRAVRQRYAREQSDREYSVDGLVASDAASKARLSQHALSARAYSATALESFGACPYRFYLKAIVRLQPREVLEPLLELDPMLRGSLVHSLQYRALTQLREERAPLDASGLPRALEVVDEAFRRLRTELSEQHLLPVPGSIESDLTVMHADARRWMEALLTSGWTPLATELAFGLSGHVDSAERDRLSQKDPVPLASGIRLRGAIDLVEEREGVLRATDHKTGRVRATAGARIGGGKSLQPALYAEALEAMPIARGKRVEGGRLSYCTTKGGFSEVNVPLDAAAREGLAVLTSSVTEELARGRLLRRPGVGECTYCDYQALCGPDEARRAAGKKVPDALARLRRTP
jgi:RecB family exonuclease